MSSVFKDTELVIDIVLMNKDTTSNRHILVLMLKNFLSLELCPLDCRALNDVFVICSVNSLPLCVGGHKAYRSTIVENSKLMRGFHSLLGLVFIVWEHILPSIYCVVIVNSVLLFVSLLNLLIGVMLNPIVIVGELV